MDCALLVQSERLRMFLLSVGTLVPAAVFDDLVGKRIRFTPTLLRVLISSLCMIVDSWWASGNQVHGKQVRLLERYVGSHEVRFSQSISTARTT